MREKSSQSMNTYKDIRFRGGETKRMKKKLSSLLVFALVLTMLAPAFAFAAAPADVTDSNQKAAVSKLISLGVVNGYEDGTIRPNNDITRAEFAKLVSYAAGFGTAAEYVGAVDTGFKDVKASHWAAGYIAVAANKGYVKGYEDGTFRPEGKITNAEVITVLLRVLGYTDEGLVGNWPSNYIIQANALKLLSNVEFSASAKATRGNVFVLTSETLEKELVTYNTDTKRFDKETSKLIEVAFETAFQTDVLVSPVLVGTNKDQVALATAGNVSAAADLTVVGADNFAGLLGRTVKYLKVDGKVSYIQDAQGTVVEGTLTSATSATANAVTTYTLNIKDRTTAITGTSVTFFLNGKSTTNLVALADSSVKVFLNADGKAQFVDASKLGNAAKITSIVTGTDYRDARVNGTVVAKDALVYVNDELATFADLKVGDVVYFGLNDITAQVVKAYNATVSGKVTEVRSGSDAYVKLDNGSTYSFGANAVVTTINFNVNDNVTILLDKDGKIFDRTTTSVASTKVFVNEKGSVARLVDNTVVTYVTLTVIKSDGTEVTYEVAKGTSEATVVTNIDAALDTPSTTAVKNVFSIKLNGDNRVTEATQLDGAIAPTTDTGTIAEDGVNTTAKTVKITVNGTDVTYFVGSSTVIFDKANSKALTLEALKAGYGVEFELDTTGTTFQFISVTSGVSASDQKAALYGVYTGKYAVTAGNTVTYYVTLESGAKAEEVTETLYNSTIAAYGDLVLLTDTATDAYGKYDTVDAVGLAAALSANLVEMDADLSSAFKIGTGRNATTGALEGATNYITNSATKFLVVTLKSDGSRDQAFAGDISYVNSVANANANTTAKVDVFTSGSIGNYQVVKAVVVYLPAN